MSDQPDLRRGGTNFNMLAFIGMAFLIVGLIGVFTTYAAPLPLEREMAREEALDAALAAAKGPNPDAALAALKLTLDDSAGVLTGGPDGIEARIAIERTAMRQRFAAESAANAIRLRWLTVVSTIMAAVFAMTMMGSAVRRPG